MRFRSSRPIVALATTALVAAGGATFSAAAPSASGTDCASRTNSSVSKLLECVTIEGVREHQAALQAIADANGGNRASGTAGYDASADYVAAKLQAAGWDVTRQPFDYQTFISLAPPILEQLAPAPVGPIPTTIFSYSGSGDVTAAVSPPSGSALGCNAADFAGFPAGNIALISRGTCTFALKATNAFSAGASAVVIYNNGPGTLNGTLGSDFTLNLPVVAVTQEVGLQLVSTVGLTLRVKTETFRGMLTTENVLAELRGKNPNTVVMAGAHLDSVNAGPGINDNGSGSGALLETAENLSKVKPRNTIRLAWWGAEESGLVGSTRYVNTLPEDELGRIALYLNFDMIGSPNHVFFVYDGDDSDAVGAGPGPEGSAAIEKTFEGFYSSRGIPFKGTDFSGRSDYRPFILAGIPSGGLFTGAEGVKTAEEAALWGGTAGIAYDPCYHQACDTFTNVNLGALETNADAVAHAVLSFGMSTEVVNGEKGKGNFKPTPDPEHEPALS